MTQGEIIQNVAMLLLANRDHEERLTALEKKVAEMDGILKSPIRRNIYAAREKFK